MRSHDTGIGGGGGRFPTTHGSAVAGMRSADSAERARSFDALVAAYWRPVYKHVRLRWGRSSEDAKDLTQAFFLRAMEKDFFAPYDPARARFRTFLRTCLDGFLANEDRAARRLKRGGDVTLLPLEFESAEGEIAAARIAAPGSVEEIFDREWVRSLFGLAVTALRAECESRGKAVCFEVFSRHDLADEPRPRYEEVAAGLGIPVTQVTNHLAFARRELRRLVLEKLREITGSEEEYRREARFLLQGGRT
jgi:RNA polymerase sigma factor (sigma-70 family)